jgi:hypothetical protein
LLISLLARQGSNLQPDRYERRDKGRRPLFSSTFREIQPRSFCFVRVVSGAKLVRLFRNRRIDVAF